MMLPSYTGSINHLCNSAGLINLAHHSKLSLFMACRNFHRVYGGIKKEQFLFNQTNILYCIELKKRRKRKKK